MENFHLQQIMHFLKKHGSDLAVCTMFESRYMQDAALQGGVSMLYKLFTNPLTRLSNQVAWEKDLDTMDTMQLVNPQRYP